MSEPFALGRKSAGSPSAAGASRQSGETPGVDGDRLSDCFLLNSLQKQPADGAEAVPVPSLSVLFLAVQRISPSDTFVRMAWIHG